MRRLLLIIAVGVIATFLFFVWMNATEHSSSSNSQESKQTEKLYVAVEGEGKVAVIDLQQQKVIKDIHLISGEHRQYNPHNIQVSPDRKTVWVTANVTDGMKDDHSMEGMDHGVAADASEIKDEVIVLDAQTDTLLTRIPIAPGQHLAHVVLTPDSSRAYVTAEEGNKLYVIDAKSYRIVDSISMAQDSPHGLRISPDGTNVYIALMGGNGLGIFNRQTGSVRTRSLGGKGVQTGVSPDGVFVTASVYDTKQLAILNLKTDRLTAVNLPDGAKGPVQMYITPDSRFAYVADQGYYFGQPAGNMVYKVDLRKQQIVQAIPAGSGPHGIVIDRAGKYVYVTNLLSNDVSVIDTSIDKEIARIQVGKMPNGISM